MIDPRSMPEGLRDTADEMERSLDDYLKSVRDPSAIITAQLRGKIELMRQSADFIERSLMPAA